MRKIMALILITGLMGTVWGADDLTSTGHWWEASIVKCFRCGADDLTSTGQGSITELEPIGAPYTQAGTIQFRCTTTNLGPRNNIPPSTCTLTITYGDEVVQTITYNVPNLRRYESYTYVWTTTNVNFPYDSFQTGGSYTITANWLYSGGSDSKSTIFQSIPTGWPAVIVAAIIFLTFIYLKKPGK